MCLPTGFGKTGVCYNVLPFVFDTLMTGESIVVVVSPLKADQVDS